MRVIAGSAKGRRLVAPAGTATRPTADRVRGAIFNAIGSLGPLAGAEVLDLFAGSGAMAIEALSRGAAHATLCDTDRRAREAIVANLAASGLAERATVLSIDAMDVASTAADIAFCDPPYRYDRWPELLDRLAAPLVVIESDRAIEAPPGWQLVRAKAYGTTVVCFLEQHRKGT